MHNEEAVTARFLDTPNEDTYADLFHLLKPQLLAFFRARNCEPELAEDLTQEVLLTVYRKASQVRDRPLFRAWLFKAARNVLCRHCERQAREVETMNMADVGDRLASTSNRAGTPAFEFLRWMTLLDMQERETMTLRFIEQWEYHEIAAAKSIPIGTVQWRVFNAKKKLAPHLIHKPGVCPMACSSSAHASRYPRFA